MCLSHRCSVSTAIIILVISSLQNQGTLVLRWRSLSAMAQTADQGTFLNSVKYNSQGSLRFGKQPSQKQATSALVAAKQKDSVPVTSKLKGTNIRAPGTQRTESSALDTSKYLQLAEIEAYLKSLAKAYPNVVQLQTIGYTHEKRPITLVKVGTGNNKPAFWIDAGIHAREWIAPSTALYSLNKLVTDPSNAQYIKKVTWYFLPVANPDGYHYSRSSSNDQGRMWRKNRRPGSCTQGRKCCVGVDLNRNFNYSFGTTGTSTDPCTDIYMGPSAFSEPESQAMRNFILQHKDIKAAVTMHSYAQMWFYPYGDKRHSLPADWKELAALAKKAVKALKAYRGTNYRVGTAADILYPSGGGSDDWSKAVAGIKYVYCVELPPAGGGFFPPVSMIAPTGEETWAAIRVVADEIGGGSSSSLRTG